MNNNPPETERTDKRLSGQVAIVTGGGSGIGRAVCLALAREGAHVVVVDISPAGMEATLAQCADNDVLGLCLDVSREADMENMARQTLDRYGRIDILVACAGILRRPGSSPKLVVDTAVSEWDAILDVNLKGAFLSNRAVLPAMIRQQRGSIINLSSVAGRVGRAYTAAYCASKFGLIGFSEALAEEGRQHNIRVHTVLPDAVDTPMWEQNGPIPRPAAILPPERVADLIVYLLLLPEDTLLINPVIAPFQSRRRRSPSGR